MREYKITMTGPGLNDKVDINLEHLTFQDAVHWAYRERCRRGFDWLIHSVTEIRKKLL